MASSTAVQSIPSSCTSSSSTSSPASTCREADAVAAAAAAVISHSTASPTPAPTADPRPHDSRPRIDSAAMAARIAACCADMRALATHEEFLSALTPGSHVTLLNAIVIPALCCSCDELLVACSELTVLLAVCVDADPAPMRLAFTNMIDEKGGIGLCVKSFATLHDALGKVLGGSLKSYRSTQVRALKAIDVAVGLCVVGVIASWTALGCLAFGLEVSLLHELAECTTRVLASTENQGAISLACVRRVIPAAAVDGARATGGAKFGADVSRRLRAPIEELQTAAWALSKAARALPKFTPAASARCILQ